SAAAGAGKRGRPDGRGFLQSETSLYPGPVRRGARRELARQESKMSAFVPGPRCNVAGAATGPLAGMPCAVKDLSDVAGVPTGGGNPDWPRIYPTPAEHAWVVQRLLDSGASIIGKTVTDEVSLGILGE